MAVPQYKPTPSLVGIALLKLVLAPFTNIAGALPKPSSDNTWMTVAGGFIQVQASLLRAPNVDVPQRRASGYQVDAYAAQATGQSNKPLWARAEELGELVRFASEDAARYGTGPITLALPNNHDPARVLSWWLLSEPTRVPDDPSGYARVSLDLAIDWVRP